MKDQQDFPHAQEAQAQISGPPTHRPPRRPTGGSGGRAYKNGGAARLMPRTGGATTGGGGGTPPLKTGHFYGLGAGPGATDLMTVRAHRLLSTVPVVVYPACKPGASSYAWRIVRDVVPANTRVLAQVFPMSRDWASLVPVWRENARAIADELRQGHDVAFVTEGDPMLFSTFLHVRELLLQELPEAEVEIVPGLPALSAAAALTGIPLGQGDQRIAVVPATWHADRLREVLLQWDVVVLMKVARVLPTVIDVLVETGRIGHAALISRATAEQQIVTRDLARFRDRRLNYLTLVLVGQPLGFVEELLAGNDEAQEPS